MPMPEVEVSKDTQEFAEAFSRWVNGHSHDDFSALGQAMTYDHRTLVQEKMRVFISFLRYVAEMPYDARNEASVKLARAIVSDVDLDLFFLPFI